MSRTAAAILRGIAPALAQEAESQHQPEPQAQPEIFAETNVGQVIEYVAGRFLSRNLSYQADACTRLH